MSLNNKDTSSALRAAAPIFVKPIADTYLPKVAGAVKWQATLRQDAEGHHRVHNITFDNQRIHAHLNRSRHGFAIDLKENSQKYHITFDEHKGAKVTRLSDKGPVAVEPETARSILTTADALVQSLSFHHAIAQKIGEEAAHKACAECQGHLTTALQQFPSIPMASSNPGRPSLNNLKAMVLADNDPVPATHSVTTHLAKPATVVGHNDDHSKTSRPAAPHHP